MHPHAHELTAALLCEVFPDHPKYRNPAFLEWEYLGSPSGEAIEANAEDEHGRTGHYAVIPQRWMVDGRPSRYALSLDSSVAERSRGKGLFSTLGNQVAERARASEYTALIGLANAQATPGQVRNIGFELIRPLPVAVYPPTVFEAAGLSMSLRPRAWPTGWRSRVGPRSRTVERGESGIQRNSVGACPTPLTTMRSLPATTWLRWSTSRGFAGYQSS